MFSEPHFDHTRPKFATSIRVNITNSLVKKDKIVTKKINMKRSSYGDSKISSKNKRDKEKNNSEKGRISNKNKGPNI